MTDIIDELVRDHRGLCEVFAALRHSARDREALFRDLVAALARQQVIEESLVHEVVLEELPEERPLVAELVREQRAHERRLAFIADLDVEAPEFVQQLRLLERAVVDHFAREEREEFPLLRDHLSNDRRRELAHAYARVREVEPSPSCGGHRDPSEVPPHDAEPVVCLLARVGDAVRELATSGAPENADRPVLTHPGPRSSARAPR